MNYVIYNYDKPVSNAVINSSLEPQIEPTPDNKWRLIQDWVCVFDGITYTVPEGFETDGASIPRLLWTLFGSPMELPRAKAAILHDYLYTIGPKEPEDQWDRLRLEADEVYKNFNIQLGMKKWKANIEYRFIRWFGGSHWNPDET